MQHSTRRKPTLVAEARSLMQFRVENVTDAWVKGFLAWCKTKDITPVGRGRTTHGVLSLQFDAADAYKVTAWFKRNDVTVRPYSPPAASEPGT